MSDRAAATPVVRLLAWLAERGMRMPGARAETVPGMGTGLLAAHDLMPEDEILFVPRDLWVTRKTAHTVHRDAVEETHADGLFAHGMGRLALLVALERETPESFFRTYLDALDEPTVPYDLTPEERAAIQGLPLAAWIDEQRAELDEECARLQARVPVLDVAAWRWAFGHVMQRTFTVDVEDEEVWVLVPGMDLCNHDQEPNARFFAEEDGWYLEAARPVAEGEQITIRYGRAKTSTDLLLYYGFVTPDNAFDRVHLELRLRPDDPDEAEKLAAVQLLGLETDTLVGPDGRVPSTFLHTAIVWGMDSEAFRAAEPDVRSPDRAARALGRMASAIEHALDAFPTTIEQDEAALANAPASGWLRTFIAYRLNAKCVHRTAAKAIRERVMYIQSQGWRPEEIVADDPDGRYGLATVRIEA